jgi:hypothetical protein
MVMTSPFNTPGDGGLAINDEQRATLLKLWRFRDLWLAGRFLIALVTSIAFVLFRLDLVFVCNFVSSRNPGKENTRFRSFFFPRAGVLVQPKAKSLPQWGEEGQVLK